MILELATLALATVSDADLWKARWVDLPIDARFRRADLTREKLGVPVLTAEERLSLLLEEPIETPWFVGYTFLESIGPPSFFRDYSVSLFRLKFNELLGVVVVQEQRKHISTTYSEEQLGRSDPVRRVKRDAWEFAREMALPVALANPNHDGGRYRYTHDMKLICPWTKKEGT